MFTRIFMALMASALIASCSSTTMPEAEGERDEHEEVSLQYTTSTDSFEVFAEGDAFITGETANLTAYITVLPGFGPADNAELNVGFSLDGSGSSQPTVNRIRPGVFTFSLTPDKEGKGKLFFEIRTAEDKYNMPPVDVTVYGGHEQAHEATANSSPANSNTTAITKEQAWKMDFATGFPEREPFGQVIKTTARVQPALGDERIITATTGGIIVFSDFNSFEGKDVAAGQVLFSISGGGLSDNNIALRLTEAKNNYELAKAEYERVQQLAAERIVPQSRVLTAKNDFDNALALYGNLNQNFVSGGQTVRSPVTGFIRQVYAENGAYIETGQPVMTISQSRSLLIIADLPQKYAPVLGKIKDFTVSNLYENKVLSMEELNGRILSYGKAANDDNYLIPVTIQIENKGGFFPGSFTEVYFRTITGTDVLTVPNTALMEDQGVFFIYVQVTPELFEKREVKTGTTDGLRTEIISGISEKERIVTRGALILKLAQATGGLDPHAGHVH
jgi:membrane fusion protein, heavy metal efflux system